MDSRCPTLCPSRKTIRALPRSRPRAGRAGRPEDPASSRSLPVQGSGNGPSWAVPARRRDRASSGVPHELSSEARQAYQLDSANVVIPKRHREGLARNPAGQMTLQHRRILRLHQVQTPESALGGQQLLRRPALDDPAALKKMNPICCRQRRQSMRDDQHCHRPPQPDDCLLNEAFRLRV